MSLRWTRSLVYSEVVLFVFVVVSYIILTVMGVSSSTTGGSSATTVSGSTIAALIAVALLAIVLTYLAVDLRNKRNSTRIGIALIQVLMLVFGIVTSLTSPISVALIVVLTAGTLFSLYAPASNAAFAQAAAGAGKLPEPELPEELQKIFDEAKAKKAAEASSQDSATEEESTSTHDKA